MRFSKMMAIKIWKLFSCAKIRPIHEVQKIENEIDLSLQLELSTISPAAKEECYDGDLVVVLFFLPLFAGGIGVGDSSRAPD